MIPNKKKNHPLAVAFFLCLGITTLNGQVDKKEQVAPKWFQLIRPTSVDESKEERLIQNLVVKNQFSNSDVSLVLHQNKPNPFSASTLIKFELLKATSVDLTIYDVEGKVVKSYRDDFQKGMNELIILAEDLNQQGVLYYQMTTAEQILSKTMIFKR